MIKITSFAFLLAFASQVKAQYAQVTHTSGTQMVAGVNITVTSSGSAFTIAPFCGAAPYWIGWNTNSIPVYGQYSFAFGPGVSSVKVQVTAFSGPPQEVDSFFINGAHYQLTAANLVAFPGTCNQAQATISNGNLLGLANAGGNGGEVLITPGFPINSLKIATNGTSNGNVFNLFIDSGFNAGSNSPLCAGDTLKLTASTVPGAAYNWTGPNGFASTLQNPVIPAATVAASGLYIAIATTSASTKTDSVMVTVLPGSPSPVVTTPVNYCQNASSTPLTATGTNLLWFTTPTGGTGSSTAPTPSTTNLGTTTYYVSQVVAGSCRGPRAAIDVIVAPLPDAVFTYTIGYGCDEDTVTFNNVSLLPGATTHSWSFGDGSTDTAKNPRHIYPNQGI